MNMMGIRTLALASISLTALSTPAFAQVNEEPVQANAPSVEDDIVVTARRRDESAQDVPFVVQAVTAQELSKLNIREFRDVQTLVPGLSIGQDSNGIGNRTTLRGIAYDVNASGNNGTVEFYFNEAPISAALLLQSMFDIGQIEVLRGPQGTLRGRASPSGSITVTSHRPDLSEVGAVINGTVNSWGEFNVNGAINLPIVRDRLAIRIAGLVDETDDNRVYSLNNAARPSRETQGIRVSAQANPIDDLTLNASYTHTNRRVSDFVQVESGNIAQPGLAASPTLIRATDRLGVLRPLNTFEQNFTVYNWSAQYRALGQKLDYVGSHNTQRYDASAPNDFGAALPDTSPAEFLNAAQVSHVRGKQTNHEIRLSSDERIAGIFDYVVGALFNKLDSPTNLEVQTPVYVGTTAVPRIVGGVPFVNRTPVVRTGGSNERSFFGNLTAHIGENTEVSGGIRSIRYRSVGGLVSGGVVIPAATEDRVLHATIYSASVKHNWSDNFMTYANFGTSWRAGSASNAIQTRGQASITGSLLTFLFPEPETSKGYELGFKATLFDGRVRFNADVYQQTFKNFQYAAPNIFYLTTTSGVNGVGVITTLVAGVPAKVRGMEAELFVKVTPNWNISVNAAYSKGKISNATIPCNNYGGVVPSAAQLLAANNGQQISTCTVSSLRAGTGAPFVATATSEYNASLTDSLDGYLRGLVTYNGNSLNDPQNAVDDIPAYANVNLFAGLRSSDSGWEIGAFVKNVFDVERVLSRNATTAISGVSVAGGTAPVSTYRVISMTPPREVGITARFAIGSR
jgi:iron complex outermembrane receptor protein